MMTILPANTVPRWKDAHAKNDYMTWHALADWMRSEANMERCQAVATDLRMLEIVAHQHAETLVADHG